MKKPSLLAITLILPLLLFLGFHSTWSDGKPIFAANVVAGMDQVCEVPSVYPTTWLLTRVLISATTLKVVPAWEG